MAGIYIRPEGPIWSVGRRRSIAPRLRTARRANEYSRQSAEDLFRFFFFDGAEMKRREQYAPKAWRAKDGSTTINVR